MPNTDDVDLYPEKHADSKSVRWTEKVAAWLRARGKAIKAKKGLWKWLVALALSVFAFIVLVCISRRLRTQERTISVLAHERDVLDDQAQRVKVLASLAAGEENAQRFEEAAQISIQQVQQLEMQLMLVKDAKAKTEATIAAIKNWRDVDEYLASGKS